jgi:hypothetical protein
MREGMAAPRVLADLLMLQVVTGKYPVIKCTELAKPRLGF